MPRSAPEPPTFDDEWIISKRGARNDVSTDRPYAYLVERERTREGPVEDVATVFITNKECPFRCLMCDLWVNTTSERIAEGAAATQVQWALERLPETRHVKLYNSGNFFDEQAVCRADRTRIAKLLRNRRTVIVESHPRLVGRACLEFAEELGPELHVAMGLETVDPKVLPRLNKRMTLGDFERAARLLVEHGMQVRAFILLRTPFQSEEEGVVWAMRSIDFAFSVGVECCAVIPTRAGNGAMDELRSRGLFAPPDPRSLEEVVEYGVGLNQGRVFADLWDIERLFDCPQCGTRRAERLKEINHTQSAPPRVACDCAV